MENGTSLDDAARSGKMKGRMPTTATRNRLATILQRELGATVVKFVPSDEEPPEEDRSLTRDLGRGRHLVVGFDDAPTDLAEKRAKLETLVESFAELFAEVELDAPKHRPEPAEALKTELSALAGRTGASVALVIDAASPVVWGASEAPTGTSDPSAEDHLAEVFSHLRTAGITWLDLLVRRPTGSDNRKESEDAVIRPLRLVPPIDELAALSQADRDEVSRRAALARAAISRIRKNPLLVDLHHGKHLHEAVLEEGLGYLARSFAGIYVLVLVWPAPFDELGAERAVVRALPSIERHVVALPPDDSPTHGAGSVVALRGRRRR